VKKFFTNWETTSCWRNAILHGISQQTNTSKEPFVQPMRSTCTITSTTDKPSQLRTHLLRKTSLPYTTKRTLNRCQWQGATPWLLCPSVSHPTSSNSLLSCFHTYFLRQPFKDPYFIFPLCSEPLKRPFFITPNITWYYNEPNTLNLKMVAASPSETLSTLLTTTQYCHSSSTPAPQKRDKHTKVSLN
jgi:hypothetical protein